MNTIASLLVRLGINTQEFDQGIDRAEQKSSKLGGILKGAFSIAAVGATALAGAIGFAGAAGLKFNNAMELTSARIQAFTKDSAKTAEMLDMIKQRAASTPFAFEEMASATANLLPAAKQSGKGIEELIGLAEILAASNPAQGLDGAAFSLKEALGGDFVSIVERFNLPRQRLKQLKEEGVPALEAIRIAMTEMGLDADLVSGLANTASGRWSTFKDTMVGVASTVTKPLFDVISNSLGGVNSWLTANQPLLDTFAATLASNVAGAIASVSSGFTIAKEIIDGLASGNLLLVVGHLSAITGIDVSTLINGFNNIKSVVETLPDTFGSTVDTISTRINTIVSIVQLVISQVTNTFNQYGPEIIASASTTFNSVLSTINTVLTAINTIVNAVLLEVYKFWAANGQDILNTVAQVWLQISGIINTAMQLISAVVNAVLPVILGFIKEHSDDIQRVLSGAWEVIKGVVQTALTVIQGALNVALAVINGDWSKAWQEIQSVADKTGPMIKSAIEGLFTAITGLFGTSMGEIKTLWQNNWNMLVTIAEKLPGKFVEIAQNIGNSIKNTFKRKWNEFIGEVRGLIDQLPDVVKQALGIGSPSKVMADIFNDGVVGGMILGIEQGSSALMGAIDGLVSSASAKAQEGAKQVSEGFTKGLESGVGQMEKTFGNLMNSGIGAAMGALGISSPSTVFANIAVESVNGLIVGWEATMPQFIKMTGAHAYEMAENILKGFEGLARGALNIFKNIRALEVIPAFKPLDDATKAFESAQKRVNDLDTKMGDINKRIASMGGFQGGATDAERKHNEELLKLLAEQSKLRDDQNVAQQELTDAAMRQSQAQGNANKQAKSLEAIASEAAARYVQLEKITNEMMLTDPKKALAYFEREKAQIQELAQLERERALASSDAEKTALDTQIRLLKAAHDAEDRSVNAQISLEGIHDRWSPKMIVDVITQALKNAGISVDLQLRTGG